MSGLATYSDKRAPLTTLGQWVASAAAHFADAELQRWVLGAEPGGANKCPGQGLHCRE